MDKGENVKTVSKCVSVLDAVHWIDATIREFRSSTIKKCFLKCGIRHFDESSTLDNEDNVALNELVLRAQGHSDLSPKSIDDFVACDYDLETCDNTTTDLENQILNKYLKQQNKIPAESDDEENETSSTEKCSKSPLTSVRATLKCVEDINFFLLDMAQPTFVCLSMKLKKDCAKCQRMH